MGYTDDMFEKVELSRKFRNTVGIAGLLLLILAAGIWLYHDFYTLKEADLIIFAGQSNMSGAAGNAEEAPKLIKGAGYEYRAITRPEELCELQEPFGENEHKEGYLDDRELLERKGSLVTAFVNAYYQETGERVVAVSASRGSARVSSFNSYLVDDLLERLENAKRVMTEQKVNVRHIYMVWFQGETDAYLNTTEEEYIGEMQQLLYTLQPSGVEKCFVIQIGNVEMAGETVDTETMQKIQQKLCDMDDNFVLVSELPKTLGDETHMEDHIHFTQQGLNLIGADAGKNAGKYVKTNSEGN